VEDFRVFAMENGFAGGVYAMGPRIPPVNLRRDLGTMTSTLGFKVPAGSLIARADKGEECTDARLCEKPVGSSSLTLPIVLGVW
jgi:hypothetical protein